MKKGILILFLSVFIISGCAEDQNASDFKNEKNRYEQVDDKNEIFYEKAGQARGASFQNGNDK